VWQTPRRTSVPENSRGNVPRLVPKKTARSAPLPGSRRAAGKLPRTRASPLGVEHTIQSALASVARRPSALLDQPWLPWSPRREVPPVPAGYRADFNAEFLAETQRLMPAALNWFTGLTAGITLLLALREGWGEGVMPLLRALHTWTRPEFRVGELLGLLPSVVVVGVFGVVFSLTSSERLSPPDVVRFVQRLLLWTMVVAMSVYAAVPYWSDPTQALPPLALFFIPSLVAAATLPITDNQLRWPILPLVLLNAALVVAFAQTGLSQKVGWSILSCVVPVPALVVAYFKHRWRLENFKVRFFESRYGSLRKELVDARRLHEALFPKPQSEGRLRFDFAYQPMRQIGGDYLFARFVRPGGANGAAPGATPASDAPSRLDVVLVDVTGHGVSAALTVNRISGEVERVYAENPDATPDQVLRALNRYVYLTLANHAVFGSALCARFDPDQGLVRFASAGHPPAFLRRRDASLTRLDSTAPMLGVLPDPEFAPVCLRHDFDAGDTFVAYTDGAIEAVDSSQQMFGIERVRALIGAGVPEAVDANTRGPGRACGGGGVWSRALLDAVDSFRDGPTRDDTLAVEVTAMPEPAVAPVVAPAVAPSPAPAAAPAT
jgi:hypothetical protein